MTRARDLADSADKDIAGTLTLDGLTVDGSSSIRHTDATTNISLTPTSTGGVVNVRDSSGNSQIVLDARTTQVGIGTSSPSNPLTVDGDNNSIRVRYSGNTNFRSDYVVASNGQTTVNSYKDGDNTWQPIRLQGSVVTHWTNGAERMRIDSSGNVGINTSSAVPLDANAQLLAIHGDAVGAERAQIKLTTTTSGQAAGDGFYIAVDDSAAYISQRENQPLVILTNATERMRIDSSGNVLVGTTDSTPYNNSAGTSADNGIALGATGLLSIAKVNDQPLILNRTGSDGGLLRFNKNGSAVGTILTISGAIQIVTGTIGIGINDDNLYPTDGSGNSTDNVLDVGDATARWDDVYATNGTIQTSDQNEKQQIASLTDAEMTAAKAISKLFKTFKWNDSVAEKGDAARTHSGVIAQDVEQAMTDAGLDAGDYAFFISTTWWETQTEVPAVEADEENGVEAQEAYTRTDTYDTLEEAPEGATERNRKGIRYPQLLSFIGAATEQRLASIETRLDALEA